MASSFQSAAAVVRSDLAASSLGSLSSPAPIPTSAAAAAAAAASSSTAFAPAPSDPRAFPSLAAGQFKNMSPPSERRSLDKSVDAIAESRSPVPSVLVRKLPPSTTREALQNIFLFADDLVDVFLTSAYSDDPNYSTAIARFKTSAAAHDVQRRLTGKRCSASDAPISVELLNGSSSPQDGFSHHKSPELASSRQLSTSASSRNSSINGHGARQSSRFNSTFQSMGEKIAGSSALQESQADGSIPAAFNPQSPRGNAIGDGRITGKSLINDDSADDETGDLLKDPVAYARNGQALRRQSAQSQHVPIGRMAGLTLNTQSANSALPSQMMSPTSGFMSARSIQPLQSPTSELPSASALNGMTPLSPTGAFAMSPQFQRAHQYPPANPADQNPPCNTLYVGNLPIDTSEDELKAMFSKQRGYKRLCFRTKHNGPMCFVEFEDVSFATKALNELYGHPLHNSVKGGIRLSFSKNPLGVRTGQANSLAGASPLGSPNSLPGIGGGLGAPPGFGAPPPGLGAPPGLSPPLNSGSSMTGFFGPGNTMSQAPGQGFASRHGAGPGGSNSSGFPGAIPNGYASEYMNGR